ncbi:hypothetical protein ACFOZ0_06680 [Streptomyces yaanensis]|uniref:Uncharacterized protein n=1 Tax=Streptomyces yaanensis TaxID=1142239 RepID=A0ABV7SBZ2_9ACTN|nr:hypothetical protein [Streptomyces sp. CGMCC 4.7035]WNC02481.1 hypothetical protein Q2K21_32950 [Streptomyces sp. CGMCC 4.7035]
MTARASRTDPDTATAPLNEPYDPVTTTGPRGPRAAAERVVSADSGTVRIGDLRLELPPRDQLAYLAGLGVLTVLKLIEWPIALAIAVGHELARSHHAKALREFGEALEEA